MTSMRTVKRLVATLCLSGAALALPTEAATAQTAAVIPTVSCAIRGSVVDTYWFGYVNDTGGSINVPVGSSNKIPRTIGRITSNDASQPDQFRPGTVARSVAVQVLRNTPATWTITAFNSSGQQLTASATASSTTPNCPRGTSPNSANVRVATASIHFAPETQVRDAAGVLTAASVKFSVSGQRTVCSLGGIPATSSQTWGWTDNFGVAASAQVQPYAPLAPAEVIRVDTFNTTSNSGIAGTVSYERTTSSVRTVINPQALVTQSSFGVDRSVYGWSATVPTVDITGKCRFLTESITASSFVGGAEGQYSYSVTDAATQTTKAPVFCVFGVTTCDVFQEIVGPGGLKISR
jgi:hypothetical protein